jgi:hypothetical protein
MNDERGDIFEADAAAGIKKLGAADPAVVERLQGTVTSLPDRRRRPAFRSVVSARRMLGLGTAIAVVAIIAATLVLRPAGPGSPSPTTDLSLVQFAKDPRMLACEKAGDRTLNDVLSAFELAHGKDYRANLEIPLQADLASAEQPALVVVFKTGDSSSSIGGNPPLVFTPPPGTRSVCVGLTGVKDPVLITNVDESKIILPPASSPPGPIAGVFFANTRAALAAMAWDASRQSLWIVNWETGPTAQLIRVGLDGKSESWPLPNGPNIQIQPVIQAGLVQPAMPAAWYGWDATDVVVDGEGKVWIAAGYGLVRFDPDTGKSQLRTFTESDATKVYVDGGHWLSAIAADGDGVLVARNGESALTRVDESLADAGTITLPSSWTGVRGIAVVGDRILAGGASGLGMFDRTGVQLGQASIVVQFASLRPMGPDRAAVVPTTIGDSVATVVDRNGAVVGTVAIPMEPIRSNLGYDRLVLATDWTNHVWYGEWDDEAPVYLVEAALAMPH